MDKHAAHTSIGVAMAKRQARMMGERDVERRGAHEHS